MSQIPSQKAGCDYTWLNLVEVFFGIITRQTGIYSARPGRDWRVLYEIDETKHAVIVLDIRHRSTAYRTR